MNVYDFDGTIFPGDCALGFAFWCTKRHPKLWFTYFPRAIGGLIQHLRGKMPNFRLQSATFGYLTQVDDFDEQIELFWDKNEGKIAPWYLAQKRSDDLIISASPDCIIAPIANRLGVKHVATEYDRELALCAEKAYFEKDNASTVVDWPELDEATKDEEVRQAIDTGWNIHVKE